MEDRIAPFVRAGRAAFGVVLEGYIERLRPANFVRPAVTTVEFTDIVVSRVTDLRRGLDYLETRPDIDMTRVAALAPSAGSVLGIVIGGLETRYRTFVFIGAGLPGTYRAISAAANPINFASYIQAPKLILQDVRRGHPASNSDRAVLQTLVGTEATDALRWRARALNRSDDEHDQRLAG